MKKKKLIDIGFPDESGLVLNGFGSSVFLDLDLWFFGYWFD
jgi:hypothetical protein